MKKKKKGNDLDVPIHKPLPSRLYCGMGTDFTLRRYERMYLAEPVFRDGNNHRRFTQRQLDKLRKIWISRNPDRPGDPAALGT